MELRIIAVVAFSLALTACGRDDSAKVDCVRKELAGEAQRVASATRLFGGEVRVDYDNIRIGECQRGTDGAETCVTEYVVRLSGASVEQLRQLEPILGTRFDGPQLKRWRFERGPTVTLCRAALN